VCYFGIYIYIYIPLINYKFPYSIEDYVEYSIFQNIEIYGAESLTMELTNKIVWSK